MKAMSSAGKADRDRKVLFSISCSFVAKKKISDDEFILSRLRFRLLLALCFSKLPRGLKLTVSSSSSFESIISMRPKDLSCSFYISWLCIVATCGGGESQVLMRRWGETHRPLLCKSSWSVKIWPSQIFCQSWRPRFLPFVSQPYPFRITTAPRHFLLHITSICWLN